MILSLSCYSFATWFSEAISVFVISPKERYCSLFHVAYYRDKLFWFVAHCLLSGGRLKEEDCVTRQKRAKQNCKSSETNHTKDIAYLKWDQTRQMYQIYKRTPFSFFFVRLIRNSTFSESLSVSKTGSFKGGIGI